MTAAEDCPMALTDDLKYTSQDEVPMSAVKLIICEYLVELISKCSARDTFANLALTNSV